MTPTETLCLYLSSKDEKYELEYKFHPTRKWRFDIAIPRKKIAIEVEGGTWVLGRHNNPTSFEKELEKYNAAVCLGWRVLRFTPGMIKKGICDIIDKGLSHEQSLSRV
jgi:very-short-patch-repair endonuclease